MRLLKIKEEIQKHLNTELKVELIDEMDKLFREGTRWAIVWLDGTTFCHAMGDFKQGDERFHGEPTEEIKRIIEDAMERERVYGLNESYEYKLKDEFDKVWGSVSDDGAIVCVGGRGVYAVANFGLSEYLVMVQTPQLVDIEQNNINKSRLSYTKSMAAFYCPPENYGWLKRYLNSKPGLKVITNVSLDKDFCRHIYKEAGWKINPAKEFIDIKALGSTKKHAYYLSSYLKTVFEMPLSHPTASITAIAPHEFWSSQKIFYNNKNKLDMKLIRRWLLDETAKAGSLNVHEMRGAGYYLNHDGEVYARSENISFGVPNKYIKHLYGEKIYIPSSDARPLDIKELISVAKKFRWEAGFEHHGAMLVAWCLLAPFSACLNHRPHIWVNGLSHSGKTWIFTNFIRKLMRGFAITPGGNSTFYGLTEALNGSSKAIVHDEFESDTTSSKEEKNKIIEFFRMCATGDTDGGLSLYKGTAGSSGLNVLQPTSMVALGSVQSCLDRDVDQSRFLFLTLDKKIKNAQEFVKCKRWVKKNDLNTLQKRNIDYVFHNFSKVQEHIEETEDRFESLYEDQASHLTRLMSVLFGFLKFYGVEQNDEYVIDVLTKYKDGVSSEDQKIIKHLLYTDFRVGNTFTNIYALVLAAWSTRGSAENRFHKSAMIQAGSFIKLNAFEENSLDVFIDLNNDIIDYKIMSSYPAKNWKSILKSSDRVHIVRPNVIRIYSCINVSNFSQEEV